jgi:hypothetical protein
VLVGYFGFDLFLDHQPHQTQQPAITKNPTHQGMWDTSTEIIRLAV